MDAEGRQQHVEELKKESEQDNIPFDCPVKVEEDNVTDEETSLDPFFKTEDLDIVENNLKIEIEEIETVTKEEQERMSNELALAVEVISEVKKRPAIEEVAAKSMAEAVVQPRPSFLGKNVGMLWVNRGSPVAASPSPSWAESSPATREFPTAENLESFIAEEGQRRAQEGARRAEWCRPATKGVESAKKKAAKYREDLSFIRGEEKSLHVQREALRQQMRQQMRALDEREEALSIKRKETLFKMRRQDLILAKLKKMGY